MIREGNEEGREDDDNEDKGKMKQYYICFSLYVLQGIVEAIPVIMPYLYPSLPSYHILALFSMTDFPFSLKFLIGSPSFNQLLSLKNTPTSGTENGKRGS